MGLAVRFLHYVVETDQMPTAPKIPKHVFLEKDAVKAYFAVENDLIAVGVDQIKIVVQQMKVNVILRILSVVILFAPKPSRFVVTLQILPAASQTVTLATLRRLFLKQQPPLNQLLLSKQRLPQQPVTTVKQKKFL